MPHSIPKGLIREHFLKAIAELDAGVAAFIWRTDGVRPVPRRQELRAQGSHRVGLPALRRPGFDARGVQRGQFRWPSQLRRVLKHLGFNVVKLAEDWSDVEVKLIVDDYFEMLRAELLGQSYSKAAHRRALAPKLKSRSDASIEFKHANISAVLVNLGLPYIDGYKPRGNFQALLATAVENFTIAHPGFVEQMAAAKLLNPTDVPLITASALGLFVPPPEQILVPTDYGQPWLSRRGRKIDFAKQDAENHLLGKLGEQFVYEVEKKRLLEAGRDDLASKVEWVAGTIAVETARVRRAFFQ